MQTRLLATTAIAVVLSASLLNGQAPALAQLHSIPLTPAQAQQFSRDLVPSSSQDFFRKGQNQFEREITILSEKRLFSPTPILKIDQVEQVEGDFLPGNSYKAFLDQADNHNLH